MEIPTRGSLRNLAHSIAPPAPLGVDVAGESRLLRQFTAVGRLKPGTDLPKAQTELATIAQRLQEEHPDTNTDVEARARLLYEAIFGVVPTVRAAISRVDSHQPLYDITTMEGAMARDVAQERASARLLSVLVVIALLLAASGLYAVMAYTVAQRIPEMGIRIAMGARRSDVLGLVVRRGLVLATVGLALGLAGSLAANWLLAPLLFAVNAFDPRIHLSLLVALMGISLLTCYLPARRAAAVDPMVALRYE